MRNFKTEALVVKRRNFGEADRIITVFTRNRGLLKIKAKGVRRINSRRAPHIELLNLCVITIYEGRGMPILTEAQSINTFDEIKGDLKKVGFAYHVCELIAGLCAEHQENRAVFALILDTLEKINDSLDPRSIVSQFEIELLSDLGFWNKAHSSENIHFVIEGILERKLKTARLLSLFNTTEAVPN